MIDRILVPLDGSPLSEAALPHAAALAAAFGSEIHLMRVLEPGRLGAMSDDSLQKRLQRREIEEYLEQLAEPLRASGASVSVTVGEGRAAEEIARQVHERRIELIIASVWGRHGPSEFCLGGTARKLIALGCASVMLVRSRTSRTYTKPADYGRIVVPVDGSRRADWALCLAVCIARAQKAEIVMVHVVALPESPVRLPRQPLEERLRSELVRLSRKSAEQYLDAMQEHLAAPDLAIRWKVVVAPRVADALVRTARGERAGLVVMPAHGASDDTSWAYGSVATGLIDHCDVPLLVLQDRPRTARPGEPRAGRGRTVSTTAHAPAG